MINVYERVSTNKKKSALIVALFFIFVSISSYVIARAIGYGPGVFGLAMIFSGISSFVGYYYSDQIVLALSGVKPANRKEHFNFYTTAENLSQAAGIPMPRLYVIEDTAMNAFATGRDPQHAAVVATTGLLSRMNRTQLEGVIAHELSHVANYDTRLMSVVTIMVGLVSLLADWFFRASMWGRRSRDDNRDSNQIQALFMLAGFILAILAPVIAQLIQLAISRSREYLADASAAKLTRYPEGLAQALEIIASDHEPLEAANKATAHMYITNPFHLDSPMRSSNLKQNGVGMFSGLFNTHPPVQDRIKALRS